MGKLSIEHVGTRGKDRAAAFAVQVVRGRCVSFVAQALQESAGPQRRIRHQGLIPERRLSNYVCEVLSLEISNETKQEHVEFVRVEAILRNAQDNVWGDELFRFNRWLIQGSRPVRTQRLYLSAAGGPMREAGVGPLVQVDRERLRIHLPKVPGSKANLGVLIRFAVVQLGRTIVMPEIPRRREAEPKPKPKPKPVVQLRTLLKKLRASGNEVAVEDLQRTVAVAFQIPVRTIKAGTIPAAWPGERRRA